MRAVEATVNGYQGGRKTPESSASQDILAILDVWIFSIQSSFGLQRRHGEDDILVVVDAVVRLRKDDVIWRIP